MNFEVKNPERVWL